MTSDKRSGYEENFLKNCEELGKKLPFYSKKANELDKKYGRADYYGNAIKLGREKFLHEEHFEVVREVLTKWGMVRGKKTGIVDRSIFRSNILEYEPTLKKLSTCDVADGPQKMGELLDLMENLKINISTNTWLVSSSKTLHLFLPKLVCPIDRKYSLQFMVMGLQSKSPDLAGNDRWYAETILAGMFDFIKEHEDDLKTTLKQDQFNTSLPKLFDNLVIAYVKHNRGDGHGK